MATRLHFQEELARLEEQALEALDMVVSSLDRTMEAVANQDTELAQIVIADDDRLDGRYLEVHQGILSLVALQAPVATDLRLVAALLHTIKHVERMGDQCVNIAKLVPVAGSDAPMREEMMSRIQRMGTQVRAQIIQAKRAFAERDAEMAEDLVRQDDLIDDLNRECFSIALDIGDEIAVREWAMCMMLTARSLERMGDNTVDIAEQIAFVVTGLFREFQDASHPGRPPAPAG